MTPTIRTVSVPVEPTKAMLAAAATSDWLYKDDVASTIWSAMLTAAPVREEGGAAELIEQLRQSEGAAVTILCDNPDFNDQPNSAVEVVADWTNWQTVRFTGHNLTEALRNAASMVGGKVMGECDTPALATREVAPAATGAGERELIARTIRRAVGDAWIGEHQAEVAADAVLALRAQPQAREEAQPVAWEPEWSRTGTDVDGDPIQLKTRWGKFTGRATLARGGDRKWGAHINYGGGKLFDVGTAEETVKAWLEAEIRRCVSLEVARANTALALYTTPPAPEAEKLRVAVEAEQLGTALADLVSWFTKPVQGERGLVWVIPAGQQGADDAVAQALAALQQDALSAAPGEAG